VGREQGRRVDAGVEAESFGARESGRGVTDAGRGCEGGLQASGRRGLSRVRVPYVLRGGGGVLAGWCCRLGTRAGEPLSLVSRTSARSNDGENDNAPPRGHTSPLHPPQPRRHEAMPASPAAARVRLTSRPPHMCCSTRAFPRLSRGGDRGPSRPSPSPTREETASAAVFFLHRLVSCSECQLSLAVAAGLELQIPEKY
jgi:hypothetical protein